jgi:steroid 5-alpha reductase family enzyme
MKALKSFPFGEALLWIGFILFVISAIDGKYEAIPLAGLFLLAAIGVRATRHIPEVD